MENLKKVLDFIQPDIEKKRIFQRYLETVLAISQNEFTTLQEILNRSKYEIEYKKSLCISLRSKSNKIQVEFLEKISKKFPEMYFWLRNSFQIFAIISPLV